MLTADILNWRTQNYFVSWIRTLQVSFSVDYRSDNHFRSLQAVSDSIAVCDRFAQVLVLELRHFASGKGEFLQRTRERDDSSDDRAGVKRGIGGNLGRDRFHICERTCRPDYSASHLPSRFSTSSCESVPLVRA